MRTCTSISSRDPQAELERAKELMVEFARQAVALGGTVSAEHGLGKRKAHLLQLQYTPEQIESMKQVKRRLDPAWILAPGNIFPIPSHNREGVKGETTAPSRSRPGRRRSRGASPVRPTREPAFQEAGRGHSRTLRHACFYRAFELIDRKCYFDGRRSRVG